jgi:hypothetical protein
MTNKKPVNIEFAPGCFDSFTGTQEELDEIVAELQLMFKDGVPEDVTLLDLDNLDQDDIDMLDAVEKRNLQ